MSEYAEDLPYWKTSKTGADGWLQKAVKEIHKAGGVILSEGFGSSGGIAAFLIRFEVDEQTYRVVWPCADSKWAHNEADARKFENSARRQAATMLYHDVKAMCVKARAIGFEVAFFSHLELSNGRVASEMVGAPGDLPKLLGTGG